MYGPRKSIPIEDRFYQHVEKTPGCWIWTGYKQKIGYGVFGIGSRTDKTRRTELAHRMSWLIHNGEIPKEFNVLHKCDNPPCVNPDHLWIGTQKENMRDCWKKGRGARLVGERQGSAKLTNQIVKEIRKSYQPKFGELSKLARKFNVSTTTIQYVVKRKSWKHL